MLLVIILNLIVVVAIIAGLVSWSIERDKKRARKTLPQRLAQSFNGSQRVAIEVPFGMTAEQLVSAAQKHGYVLADSIPGAGKNVPTLVFDRAGGTDPSLAQETGSAGRTWGGGSQPVATSVAAPPKWKKEMLVLGLVVLGALLFFTIVMVTSGGSSSPSSNRVHAGLHESTAEAACEREVLDRLAGSPTLKRSSNLAIEGGGWAIYGTATLDDGARMDYSCTVTGSEDKHEVKVTSLG